MPFSKVSKVLHRFLQWRNLKVHLVVLHQVSNFFWIGQIPKAQFRKLNNFKIHFGKYEEIYDTFDLTFVDWVPFPNEIENFLSQISTSRYLPCPTQSIEWLANNNISILETKIDASKEAIAGMKSLMKTLEMQFFIACGTLLGWFRQCNVTPYTTDTDFATWSKYLQGHDLTQKLSIIAPNHNLTLYTRFGEPVHSMEYSFLGTQMNEKVDMFFIYPNDTHFLLPYHMPADQQYAYSIYPRYKLCSIVLLGYKLLSPCDPENVILTGNY